MHGYAVMIYKGGIVALDDIRMHISPQRVIHSMICQAYGLDKKKRNFW